MTKYCIDCRHVAEEDFIYFVTAERKVRVKTTVCRAPKDRLVYGKGLPRQTDATAERHATGECGPDGLLWEPKKFSFSDDERMDQFTGGGGRVENSTTPAMREAGAEMIYKLITDNLGSGEPRLTEAGAIYDAMEMVRIKDR